MGRASPTDRQERALPMPSKLRSIADAFASRRRCRCWQKQSGLPMSSKTEGLADAIVTRRRGQVLRRGSTSAPTRFG
eukprot:5247094-Pleurochrysis_carterae.AAC.1